MYAELNMIPLPSPEELQTRERIFGLKKGDKLVLEVSEQEWTLWTTEGGLLFNLYSVHKRSQRNKRSGFFWDELKCRRHVDAGKKASGPKPDVPAADRRITAKTEYDCLGVVKAKRYDRWPSQITLECIDAHCSHGLKDSDLAKVPGFVTKAIGDEAKKGYAPLAIKEVVSKAFPDTTINYKHVANVVAKTLVATRGSKGVADGKTWEEDLGDARRALEAANYRTMRRDVMHEGAENHLLVFAKENQLANLSANGTLVLLDATHKTNAWDWYLYALVIRDKYGSWQRGGYILSSHETSAVVCEGLRCLREWAGAWDARYFLTDDSAAEKLGIKKAFPNETIATILCTVHSARTLKRQVGHLRAVESKMLGAMQRITKTNCLAMVREAIDLVPSTLKHIKGYLEKNWFESSDEWALWNRQHSPLLLQVTTTNPVEAHFRVIKRKVQRRYVRMPFNERISNVMRQ